MRFIQPCSSCFGCVHIHYEGEVVGPWNSRDFWALWNGIEPIGECHFFGGPKNSRIPRPTPLPLLQVMEMQASKSLCTGPSAPSLLPERHPTLLPTPPSRTYYKSTANCKVHKGTLRCIKICMWPPTCYKGSKVFDGEPTLNGGMGPYYPIGYG